jgi:pimeloyl-ACP methyl ester carboxylesterase
VDRGQSRSPGWQALLRWRKAVIPSLIAELHDTSKIENDIFHIAGISNGGIAAFRIAENDPETYCSMLVLPGLPGNRRDFERLERLKGIPVDMMVGKRDVRWADRMLEPQTRLDELEIPAWLRVLPGVGHVIADSVLASELFDRRDERRRDCHPGEPDAAGD